MAGRPSVGAPAMPFPSLDEHMFRRTLSSFRASKDGVTRREAGFTLLELLVVIAILGLLMALVAPRVMTLFGNAKEKIAAQSVSQIGDVLEFYRLDVGGYPTTQQGLQALVVAPAGVANWRGPYLKDAKVPVDPWGRPYQYRSPSARPGHAYDLFSLGPEGAGNASAIINP